MKATAPPDASRIRTEIAEMITTVLGDGLLDATDIGMDTRLGDDLELESIDLVTLAGLLGEWYGADVNLAEYLAGLELDEIIELTVSDLVTYVADALRAAGTGR
ncbi:acyl carrier protein [Streptomyces sp. KLOTTS4A1]|uniref:acyl carrier protein n=1 Tax=Streptomyces sp. KLOTTS4A1 TaxID=3390996 RepID=UPI0039F45D83